MVHMQFDRLLGALEAPRKDLSSTSDTKAGGVIEAEYMVSELKALLAGAEGSALESWEAQDVARFVEDMTRGAASGLV